VVREREKREEKREKEKGKKKKKKASKISQCIASIATYLRYIYLNMLRLEVWNFKALLSRSFFKLMVTEPIEMPSS